MFVSSPPHLKWLSPIIFSKDFYFRVHRFIIFSLFRIFSNFDSYLHVHISRRVSGYPICIPHMPSKSQQVCCTSTQPVMHERVNQCHGIMLVPMVHCHLVPKLTQELITTSSSHAWHMWLFALCLTPLCSFLKICSIHAGFNTQCSEARLCIALIVGGYRC